MTSFDELPLGDETVAALAAEGIETPTPFQALAIPVLARGNDLLGRAGPGSGTLVAYGAPLLDRVKAGGGAPECVVLCGGARQAAELARSFARLCEGSGHRAAALADNWHVPEQADFLFVPPDRFKALYDGSLAVDDLKAVILHDGDGVAGAVPKDRLEFFLSSLPKDCQRVFCGLPFGPDLQALAGQYARKAVTVPAELVGGSAVAAREQGAKRGTAARSLDYLVVAGAREEAVLGLAANAVGDPARRLLVFANSADQAADLGDFLAIHGYACGAPGDETAPIWLCPGEDDEGAQARDAVADPRTVATLSAAVPAGPDAMKARHAEGGPAWALAEVRELGHLKETAARAGFELRRVRPDRPARVSSRLDALADRLDQVARAPEAAPYYLLVESLLDRLSPAEAAAAALCLLDRESDAKGGSGAPAGRGAAAAAARRPESWLRLFVSAGERDGIGPGDVLGAVASESGVEGKRVGRIDVRESHSLVEVRESDAKTVIAALNGTTLGGRSVRVDYDRGKNERRGGPARSGAGRGGGPPGAGRARGGRPPVGRGRASNGKGRPAGARGRSPGDKGRPAAGKGRTGGAKRSDRGPDWRPGQPKPEGRGGAARPAKPKR